MIPFSARPVTTVTPGRAAGGTRRVAAEAAVALSYNGSTQAVMMATPADLDDFARGFTLTEGIADPAEIDSVEPVESDKGIDLRIWLRAGAAARLAERRRTMAGPVGCGLCGLDSLDQAVRPAVPVTAGPRLTAAQVMRAAAALQSHQPLHDATRAVHAAGFWRPEGGMVMAREDVGRHNALDKLAGGLLAAGLDPASGVVVMTSRVSLDLVQKVCRIGAGILIAVSAPTAAALALADEAGLTVVALARGDRFELFTRPDRIDLEDRADVA